MWLLLRRRMLVWLALAVGVPVLDWLLGKVADLVRARKGDSSVARGIENARTGVRRLRRKRR